MVFLWFSYGFPMVFLWFEMILLGICVPVVAVKFLEDAIDLTEISEDRTNKMRSLRWNLMISGDKDSPNRYIIYIYIYIVLSSGYLPNILKAWTPMVYHLKRCPPESPSTDLNRPRLACSGSSSDFNCTRAGAACEATWRLKKIGKK